jgi:hypothetical protein
MLKPGKYNPSKPDIELLDYKSKKRYGLKLEGSGALQVGTISQDDTVHIRNAGKRVGDFDEQRTWKSGRGKENLSDSPEGYWDTVNAWTLTSNHVHQTLLWRFARGLRSCDFFMPDNSHSLSWRQLLAGNRYVSKSFTSMGFVADYARVWLWKQGQPGNLTFRLHSNTGGNPGTVLKSVTVTADEVDDFISQLHLLNWTGTETLVAATLYHISVVGSSTDNKNNHWRIGGYADGSAGKISLDGVSWAVDNFEMYYYIADADIERSFQAFFLDEAMYLADLKDDLSTASAIYINGDRGKATATSATAITESTKAWVTDRWIGAFVKIIRGTGIGQVRQILSNSATSITTAAWGTTPDTTSEYIIYGTEWFTPVTGAAATLIYSVVVVNRIHSDDGLELIDRRAFLRDGRGLSQAAHQVTRHNGLEAVGLREQHALFCSCRRVCHFSDQSILGRRQSHR